MTARKNFMGFILCCPNQNAQSEHIDYRTREELFKSDHRTGYKNINSLCKNNKNFNTEKMSIKNIKSKQKTLKKQSKLQGINSIHLQNSKSLNSPTQLHHVSFAPKIQPRQQGFFSHQPRMNHPISQPNYKPIQTKQILEKNIYNSIHHPMETTINKHITNPNLFYSKTTQKNKQIAPYSPNYIFKPYILSPTSQNKSQESIMTIKRISSSDKIQFDRFHVEAIESRVQHAKKLQQINEEKHQETFRASNYLSLKKQMLSPSEKNFIRRSDLQMVKASVISKNEQPNDMEIKLTQKISQSNHNPEMSQTAKKRKYQTAYGYSIMSINSCIEQVNQSKIQQNVEESQVMNDFFNPAKNLIKKWNGKEQ